MSTNRTPETLDEVVHGMNRLSNEIKQAKREHNGDQKKLQELYVNNFSPRMAELRVIASELEVKVNNSGLKNLQDAERTMMAAVTTYTEGLTYKPYPSTTSPNQPPQAKTSGSGMFKKGEMPSTSSPNEPPKMTEKNPHAKKLGKG